MDRSVDTETLRSVGPLFAPPRDSSLDDAAVLGADRDEVEEEAPRSDPEGKATETRTRPERIL
jgi:hypothetical protein